MPTSVAPPSFATTQVATAAESSPPLRAATFQTTSLERSRAKRVLIALPGPPRAPPQPSLVQEDHGLVDDGGALLRALVAPPYRVLEVRLPAVAGQRLHRGDPDVRQRGRPQQGNHGGDGDGGGHDSEAAARPDDEA